VTVILTAEVWNRYENTDFLLFYPSKVFRSRLAPGPFFKSLRSQHLGECNFVLEDPLNVCGRNRVQLSASLTGCFAPGKGPAAPLCVGGLADPKNNLSVPGIEP
jgi:hypothetical protein